MVENRCLLKFCLACAWVPFLLLMGQVFLGFPNSQDFQVYGLADNSANALSFFLFLNLFFLIFFVVIFASAVLINYFYLLIKQRISSDKAIPVQIFKAGTQKFFVLMGLVYGIFVILFLADIHKTGVDFLKW